MEWLNEPAEWHGDEHDLIVTADAKTDFWRKTHYGFIRDSGHCFGQRVDGDLIADVTVSGDYRAQYDQAGLMVRVDQTIWLKCGIELVDGTQRASVVVTRDFSDWSILTLPTSPMAFRVRVQRQGDTLEIHAAVDDGPESLLRLAYLPMGDSVLVGPMCAAPEGDGFTVRFTGLTVRQL